jgi:secreted Zn-dependent insulinase-like peptidase
LQLTGGENNAWTSSDITNYYTIAPTHNVETAFWLESDRMLRLAFTEQSLEVQRHVVIEEFKQRNLNQPYGDISQLIRSVAFTTHPYRWPVIGRQIEDIETATLEEVKEFFYAHYAPNNAILCVSGSISFDETVRLCEKWFAPIPRREIAPRNLPVEPKQTAPRHLTVERDVPLDAIVKVYHMCARNGAEYHACDLLSDVLGTGASSRLYKELVQEKQLFNSIDASISGEIECGLLIINGKLNKGVSMEDGEAAILEEIEKLQKHGVTEREMNKVVNRFEAEHLVSNLNYTDKAISKWERGESLPDVLTLKKVATILGSDVNFILESHEDDDFITQKKSVFKIQNRIAICSLAVTVVWLIATLIFVYFKIYQQVDLWQAFIAGVPASCLVLFVLLRRWYKSNKLFSFIVISLFIWSGIAFIYLSSLHLNMWALFFIGVPIQVIFILTYRLKM